MNPIRVLVADGDQSQRATCERLLREEQDMAMVECAGGPFGVMAAVLQHHPEVLLIGLAGDNDGETQELVAAVGQLSPATRTLVLQTNDEDDGVVELLVCGARGVIGRNSLAAQLPQALRMVSQGQLWISRKLTGKLLDRALH
jgi:DNA-binding NarL/FixJ family response regulator